MTRQLQKCIAIQENSTFYTKIRNLLKFLHFVLEDQNRETDHRYGLSTHAPKTSRFLINAIFDVLKINFRVN